MEIRPLFELLHQPRMKDDYECGVIDVMIGKGNRNTRSEPAAVLLFPPQIPHNLTSGSNLDCSANPATNHSSHGTANTYIPLCHYILPHSSDDTSAYT
jgi:hypothetical protein